MVYNKHDLANVKMKEKLIEGNSNSKNVHDYIIQE
jgi:hypothetical protein